MSDLEDRANAEIELSSARRNIENRSDIAVKRTRPHEAPAERAQYEQHDASNRIAQLASDRYFGELIAYGHIGPAMRFVRGLGWMVWDSQVWFADENKARHFAISRMSTLLGHDIADRMAKLDTSTDSNTRERIQKEIITLTKAMPKADKLATAETALKFARGPLFLTADDLDKDAHLLNCTNGVLNLETGKLTPAKPSLYMTHTATAFDVNATCTQWNKTLQLIFNNQSDLVDYFQRLLGSTLHGGHGDEILPIWYGSGGNGKSTIIAALKDVLGDYFLALPCGALDNNQADRNQHYLPQLRGRRLAVASEFPERRLNEALIKVLTGGDPVPARLLYQQPFEFMPTHSMIVTSNTKPEVHGTDAGLWRRLQLIPFTADLTKLDTPRRQIDAALRTEASGILNWLVRGYQQWQSDGLRPPQQVLTATKEYRIESDLMAQFFADCLQRGPGEIPASDVYRSYKRWCDHGGEHALSSTKFGRELARMAEKKHTRTGTVYQGIRLRNDYSDARNNIKNQVDM